MAAQFFYVAAQAGIFSFLINYLTTEPPPLSATWDQTVSNLMAHSPPWLHDFFTGWFEPRRGGGLTISNKLASYLTSFAFLCFLIGRFTGAGLLRRLSAHRLLGLYAVANVLLCLLVFCKLGWLSVVCVFLTYFFMSIMFPTIFALGIYGLGDQAKQASAYIVMAIVGGAILPKAMGAVADKYDVSRGFIIPLACFIFIAYYGYSWSRLSGVVALRRLETVVGH